MFNLLSRRLLGVLQLTRMALVFTAIADSFTTLLLLANSRHGSPDNPEWILTPGRYLSVAAMSIGLYGFGMSLNDIIDRRRDRQMAAHRPLPSGRVGILTAHIITYRSKADQDAQEARLEAVEKQRTREATAVVGYEPRPDLPYAG